VDHAVRQLSHLLDLRSLAPVPPAEFRDVFDTDRYRRAQSYIRARTHFGMLASALQLLAVLAFWLGGGFGWLDERVRAQGLGPVAIGIVYVAGSA
jgi:hypothetical protein